MPVTKIATCNYCGTRAALVLRGDERHELSCGSCGAPLHDLKIMPAPKPKAAPVHRKSFAGSHDVKEMPKRDKKKRKRRKRSDFFEDLWEVVEDIFD